MSHASSRTWSKLFTTSFIATILLLPYANAQQAAVLVASQLPACALQCPVLLAAQEQCVPPYRPTTSQAVYNACFCNSDYLTSFKNGQVAVCEGICDTSESNAIRTWLTGTVCANANPTPAAGQPATTTAAGTTSRTTTGQATGTSVVDLAAARARNGTGKSWISANYGWVIFAIVMVFAAALAVFLGCWWKKRKERRHRNDPNYRSSMVVANEVAASLSNKHPVASPEMGQTARSSTVPTEPTMEQRRSMGNRPSSSSWQGGAAGVGAVGVGGASSAAAAALASSRRPNSSGPNMGMRSRSDFSMSPVSTPGVPDRDNDTPLSMSDRPLLSAAGARGTPGTPPLPAARRSSGRLQKSASDRRRSHGTTSPLNDSPSSFSRPSTAR